MIYLNLSQLKVAINVNGQISNSLDSEDSTDEVCITINPRITGEDFPISLGHYLKKGEYNIHLLSCINVFAEVLTREVPSCTVSEYLDLVIGWERTRDFLNLFPSSTSTETLLANLIAKMPLSLPEGKINYSKYNA